MYFATPSLIPAKLLSPMQLIRVELSALILTNFLVCFCTDSDHILTHHQGNSGGPVFDGSTGQVVGHTVSTQNAASEATMDDIESWEEEFLSLSKNYETAKEIINPFLSAQKPEDHSYRIHPKFHRTLSASPSGGDLFLNTTFICPDDIGPSRNLQSPGNYQAVFNRHQWDSQDVIFRNLSARIDRIDLFTRPLKTIIHECPESTLSLKIIGTRGNFKRPGHDSIVFIGNETAESKIPLTGSGQEEAVSQSTVAYRFSVDLSAIISSTESQEGCFSLPSSLANWSTLRLEQPIDNPPEYIRLDVIFKKTSFPFPVKEGWPPRMPKLKSDNESRTLEWPAETFHFSTTIINGMAITEKNSTRPLTSQTMIDEKFVWEAPIDQIWTKAD